MKSIKNILFVIVFVMVVLGQVYYLFTYYKKDKEQIAFNKSEIASVEISIERLEARLARFEDTKKELEEAKREQKALASQLPHQDVKTNLLSNLLDFVSLFKCGKIEVTQEDKEAIVSDIGDVGGIVNTITFTSSYDTSEKLVSNLSNMYQACNIKSYQFDTGVQQGAGEDGLSYRAYFGDEFDSIGETTLVFNTYYTFDDTVKDEVYDSNISGKYNIAPFKNMRQDNQGQSENGQAPIDVQSPTSTIIYPDAVAADFTLNIGDMYTSGDIYKLNGPGSDEHSNIGLNSRSNVTVTVNVYDDGYELKLEDSEGSVQESGLIACDISNPNFHIVSTMRQLETVMPNIHVNICNFASTKINVALSGSMLDNIHIYDVEGEEIFKGETKGNVSLT